MQLESSKRTSGILNKFGNCLPKAWETCCKCLISFFCLNRCFYVGMNISLDYWWTLWKLDPVGKKKLLYVNLHTCYAKLFQE